MISNQSAKWLNTLERYLGWLAVPNIAVLFVTLQVLGFFLVSVDPIWVARLALVPERVLEGEYWRLITFLALPVASQLIWVIFALWFVYFVLNSIEKEWGEFKTTLYVLVSIILTISVSFLLHYPITEVSEFQLTLFLAAATLFPDLEVRLYFAIPVKMKWLGWFSGGLLILRFLQFDWYGRIYLLAIYSNYLIFFGPALWGSIKQTIRREQYKRKLK